MNNGQEWVERLSDGIFNSNTARRDERNAILQINHYMATRIPALIQLSDPRVAAQLVLTKFRLIAAGRIRS